LFKTCQAGWNVKRVAYKNNCI